MSKTETDPQSDSFRKVGRFARYRADAFRLRLLLGGLLWRPRVAMSKNWLCRIADKNSKAYPAFEDFKSKKIGLAELAARLPHVAVIGDSITTDFHVASVPVMLWKMWGLKKGNWFLETDPKKGIQSMFERIDSLAPLVLTQHSTPTAGIDPKKRTLAEILSNRKNMITQVDEVLALGRFPDLLLVWIGVGIMDWVGRFGAVGSDEDVMGIKTYFRRQFETQMDRLCGKAFKEDRKISIVAFSFINLGAALRLKELVKAKRTENKRFFPYFEIGNRTVKTLRPEYREVMSSLEKTLNEEIKDVVASLNEKYANDNRFKIVYFDEVSRIESDRIEFLSPVDGWHLSALGQRELAQSIFPVVKDQLDFLGIS